MLRKRSSPRRPQEAGGCQMPLSSRATCADCSLGLYNCEKHMRQCNAEIWYSCENCLRSLCWDHLGCYCVTKIHGRKIEKTSAVTFANVSSKNVAQFPRVYLKPAVPVPIFDVSPPAVFLSSAQYRLSLLKVPSRVRGRPAQG